MERGIEWAAGFFEGEGCIRDGLDIAQVDPLPIEWFYGAVGRRGKLYGPWLAPSAAARGWKPKYWWKCRREQEIREVLDMLMPYLTPRRQEAARNLIEQLDARVGLTPERRSEISRKMWVGRRAKYGPCGHGPDTYGARS